MKVLIISDVHANPWALQAVLDKVGPVDRVLCAGDLVNYGPAPRAVLKVLQEQPLLAVSGNHDHAVASGADPRANPAKQPLALAMRDWTRGELAAADLSWLRNLPLQQTCQIAGTRFALVHATPRDPLHDYRLRAGVTDELVHELTTGIEADILVVGHTHWPLRRSLGALQVVNPGSVGQPLDGDARASYAVWQDGTITLHRVEYDVTQAVSALESVPIAPAHRTALVHILRHGQLS